MVSPCSSPPRTSVPSLCRSSPRIPLSQLRAPTQSNSGRFGTRCRGPSSLVSRTSRSWFRVTWANRRAQESCTRSSGSSDLPSNRGLPGGCLYNHRGEVVAYRASDPGTCSALFPLNWVDSQDDIWHDEPQFTAILASGPPFLGETSGSMALADRHRWILGGGLTPEEVSAIICGGLVGSLFGGARCGESPKPPLDMFPHRALSHPDGRAQ